MYTTTKLSEAGALQVQFQQAVALHRDGRTAEAARAYEHIQQADPSPLDALIHLAALRLAQGQPALAEVLLRRALTASPDSPEAHGNLGAALQAQDRPDEAAAHYQRALALRPDMLDARFGLAASLQAADRLDEAIACYETILATDPEHPEANYGLAAVLCRVGRTEHAIARYRAAIAADPDFAEANFQLGELLRRLGEPDAAIQCFRRALDVDPDYLEARAALAGALLHQGRDEEATAAFRAVLAAAPENADAHLGLGTALDRTRRHEEAAEHYRTVLASQPGHVDAIGGLATSLKNTSRHAEATELAQQLQTMRPDFPPALGLMGLILAETGQIDQALPLVERAAALAPDRPHFAYYLAELRRAKPGDPVIAALEAMLDRLASYPVHDQCLVLFALAKCCEDIGEKERGFVYLLQGNALKRAQIEYKEKATLLAMERIARVFTPELLAARQGQGDSSSVPVFIVGMPRSGTTLLEQILASHPAVYGAGERTDLGRLVSRLDHQRIGTTVFPESVWTLPPDVLRSLGAEYVDLLRRAAPEAARIVDKLPANFAFAGLIRLVLPNAKIIHAMRNPVDTCLSCFSKLFSGDQPFAYELGELGRYYGAYRRLMAHWRRVLPEDCLLEVSYESVVDDFETEARRVIAHCGLPWDPACLEFHKGSRPVHTASLVQVRQPIYRSAVGRWRPSEQALAPLLEGLGELAISPIC